MPILLALLAALLSGAPEKEAKPDPKDIVLVLDWRGGYTPRRVRTDPYLAVLADGTVRVAEPYARKVPLLEAKIPAAEVQALREFAEERKLFAFDARKVMREIAAQPDRPAIRDAPRTVVGAWRNGKLHEVEFEALEFYARQFPKVAALQRLRAIVVRLRSLRARVVAGGEKALTDLVKLANEHLRIRDAKAKPLTAADLVDARLAPEGVRRFRFQRTRGEASDSVSIEVPAKGRPKVAVHLTRE